MFGDCDSVEARPLLAGASYGAACHCFDCGRGCCRSLSRRAGPDSSEEQNEQNGWYNCMPSWDRWACNSTTKASTELYLSLQKPCKPLNAPRRFLPQMRKPLFHHLLKSIDGKHKNPFNWSVTCELSGAVALLFPLEEGAVPF